MDRLDEFALLLAIIERGSLSGAARKTGRSSIPSWDFYLAFGLFRIASIVEGVRARAEKGTGSSASGSEVGRLTEVLADIGCRIARRGEEA